MKIMKIEAFSYTELNGKSNILQYFSNLAVPDAFTEVVKVTLDNEKLSSTDTLSVLLVGSRPLNPCF